IPSRLRATRITNSARKIKNSTFAIAAAPFARSVNPNAPAISARIKNMIAQVSIARFSHTRRTSWLRVSQRRNAALLAFVPIEGRATRPHGRPVHDSAAEQEAASVSFSRAALMDEQYVLAVQQDRHHDRAGCAIADPRHLSYSGKRDIAAGAISAGSGRQFRSPVASKPIGARQGPNTDELW